MPLNGAAGPNIFFFGFPGFLTIIDNSCFNKDRIPEDRET